MDPAAFKPDDIARMTRNTSPNTQSLRTILSNIGSWFKINLNSLLISLLLALTVWIVAMQEQNPSMEFELETPVNIDIIGLNPSLMITNDFPDTARIRVRTQEKTMPSISAEDVIVVADLTGLSEGSHQVQLSVDIAAQAIVVSTNPSNIRVNIEATASRDFPVRADYIGDLPTGFVYRANEISGLPDVASVMGPASSIQRISEISAQIQLINLRETFTGEVRLRAWDPDGIEVTNVEITPATVNVTLPVEQEEGYKQVTLRVPITGHPATGYYMTSRIVTPQVVTLQGDPAIINTLPPLLDTETIDLTGLTDDLSVEVSLNLPEGVSVVDDPVVQVLITVAAQQDSRSLFVTVEPIGLDAGLSAMLTPMQVEVFLSGPMPALQELDPYRDIVITVEVYDLGPGTYQIQPVAQVANSSISVDSILPAEIAVEITRN